ncbi:leucine Rich repeat-containing domain protein [Oesophagostomum dentatum]|uniref:Leucine Rich repeat-containing domain protein n=1 Tax=Oesophagostomum dentatum TaxID=61180 RepID=A0A0B1TLI4_OESDE|nr:leucine Rich repeat-containing domain protein [Oesophagostomum dentatum]
MEALEEIFRKVQFDTVDFEYTFLDDDAAIALSEMFEFYESAQKLNLSFNKQITIRGWTDVFKAVKNSNSLQMLNLRYTSLSEKSLSALCRMLRGTPQPVLGCLHLENVNLFGRNLYSLVCALKFNTVLKELYLGENSIQSADGAHLYQLILNNFTIQMIDLRNNQLGDTGVAKIFEALRNPEVIKKTSLTALVLWNNKITAAGMDSVAAALCENSHLETLNIGSNPLGEAGVQRLRPALGGNGSNLRRLGLQNTQMTCQSAILLAECLADNSTLIRVDLRDNPGIGSAGLLAIHSAMKINESISLLNLDQSCIVATNVKKAEGLSEAATSDVLAKTEKSEADQMGSPSETATASTSTAEAPVTMDLSPSLCQPPPSASVGCTRAKMRFMRSSSLTCAETVADIHERIRVMAGSSTSLDETNADSTKTIKKPNASTHGALGLAEWSSLPAIPQASETTKPVVRKLRRFSVSPSSSTFDVTTTSSKPTTTAQPGPNRPTTLSIGIPSAHTISEGPLSAPVSSCSSPVRSPTIRSPAPKKANIEITIEKEKPSEENRLAEKPNPAAANNERKEECRDPESDSVIKKSVTKECESVQSQPPPPKSDEEAVVGNRQKDDGSRSSSEEPHIPTEEEVMKDVRVVIADLINYVVYEETSTIERKRSLLLQTTGFSEKELCILRGRAADESPQGRVSTPSRMVNIAEEVAEETDEMIVSGVVRSIIREVLKREKEELRNTLDRRRRRTGVASSSTPV